MRIDRLALETGMQGRFDSHIDGDDPLSASISMQRSQTVSRGEWRVRIETEMRLSCTHDDFLLCASMRAYEGETEICRRDWDCAVPRQLI